MLIPAVTEMAQASNTSPSKLLIPLPYASILGGTLTLVGTTSNLLASDISARLIGRQISMFEFTQLGVVVFPTGVLYLFAVGRHLIPARVEPDGLLLTRYEMGAYLTVVVVEEDSPLAGQPVRALTEKITPDVDVLQAIRDGDQISEPYTLDRIQPGDAFIVRADIETLRALTTTEGLAFTSAGETGLAAPATATGDTQERYLLVELVVPSLSSYVDRSLDEAPFHEEYDATVLAVRRRGGLLHHRLDELPLRGGDTLLVRVAKTSAERLTADSSFIVVREISEPAYRTEKIPLAVSIVAGVIGLAVLGVLDLVVSAVGGVIAMVLAGIVDPEELYDAVDWEAIFLLAGVIPLGIAFENTGTARFLGALVAQSADFLPVIGVLWVFYAMTVLLTLLVSNTASVVLMIPIVVDTAGRIGADPFVFILAVMFASSADFMTLIGYQTNLIVYGLGGYKFTDYFRVGAPLELLLSLVTVIELTVFWSV